MLRKCETLLETPVEIEWALMTPASSSCRPGRCTSSRPLVPDEIWLTHPKLNGHPAGVGWSSGRAVVVSCECELSRVAPGDILITRVAGPALSHILPQVGGVVAELGGSTSHLASLARERGIPAVLGVMDATTPSLTDRMSRSTASPAWCGGSHEARRAIFVTQPIAKSAIGSPACAAAASTIFPDFTAGSCRSRS